MKSFISDVNVQWQSSDLYGEHTQDFEVLNCHVMFSKATNFTVRITTQD
jgi:hypothetical protein